MNEITAAFYARVSTGRQEAEQTVLSQVAELEARLEADGVGEALRFIDEGFSRDTLERPQLDRLRDLVSERRVDRVYVQAPDRLASGPRLMLLVEEFENEGVDLVFLKGATDSTPEGKFLLSIQGASAEYEKTKIAERTRRGKLYWAREGALVAGVRQYGYRFVRRSDGQRARLEIDDFQAQVVREMYRLLVDERRSTRAIAKTLNERHVPTARGAAQWRPTTISRMLRNTVYRGTLVFQKTRAIRGPDPRNRYTKHRQNQSRPVDDHVEIAVPAIVDEETWQRAQEQLKTNSRNSRRNNRKHQYLLRSLVRCPRCDGSYTGAMNHGKRFYRCVNQDPVVSGKRCKPGSVRANRLEDAVWKAIKDVLGNPDLLEAQFAEMVRAESVPGDNNELRSTEKLLSGLDRRENRLIKAYSEEAITLDQLRPALEALKIEKSELERQKAAALDRLERAESLESSIRALNAFCAKVAAGLDRLDEPGKRELLELLIDRVEFESDDKILVHTVLPPVPGQEERDELRLYHPELVEGCCHSKLDLKSLSELAWSERFLHFGRDDPHVGNSLRCRHAAVYCALNLT